MKNMTNRKPPPTFNIEHVRRFKHYYSRRLEEGLAAISWADAKALVASVHDTLSRGNRVFAFGNGGSCAMATAFLMDLKQRLDKPLRRLIAAPLQIHEAQRIAHERGFEKLFSSLLHDEAGRGDLAVLVSSSGASDNIWEAAAACKTLGMKSVLITNVDGPLGQQVDRQVCVELGDQQPGEDVSFLLLRTAAKCVAQEFRRQSISRSGGVSIEIMSRNALGEITKFVDDLDADWLLEIGQQIVEAFLHGRRVFVYAPAGGVLSVITQHVAHNLQWDALMLVNAPGQAPRMQVQVSSVGNVAHFTGVANDRRGDLFHGRQLMFEGKKGDLVLLMTTTGDAPAELATLGGIRDANLSCYAFLTAAPVGPWTKRPIRAVHQAFSEPWVYEMATQSLGHLIGRVVRAGFFAKGHARGRKRAVDYDELLQRELKEIVHKNPGSRFLDDRLTKGLRGNP